MPGRKLIAFVATAVTAFGISLLAGSPAHADGCQPPPVQFLAAVSAIAPEGSAAWVAINQVEQRDNAQGTSSGSQLIQDLAAVVAQNGYHWNCGTGELETANGQPAVVAATGADTAAPSGGAQGNTPSGASAGSPATANPAGTASPAPETTLAAGQSALPASSSNPSGSSPNLSLIVIMGCLAASVLVLFTAFRYHISRGRKRVA